jgi:NADH dehydrogenase
MVCTVGSSAAPMVCGLNTPKQKERLVTEPDLRLKGQESVWAIGDCAFVINAQDGQPAPTTGQFAEREGRQCAENIIRVLRAGAGSRPGPEASAPADRRSVPQPGLPAVTRPFGFKPLGELCSIGGHSAVADLFGMHLSGFFAWFVWRGVYLFKLPTVGRRLQVGFDWATLLVFPRDLAYVRTEQTERVSHAHYDAGDFIFRQGDAPTNFYVVEKGEVEIVRHEHGGPEEVVAVLGAGSFFGERALVGNRPRVMSTRARTAAEVLVLGRNVFTQISGALAPLRDAVAQALNRRATEVWKGRPEAYELLKNTPIRSLLEPVPKPVLHPTATLREVGHGFVEHGHEFFYVSSDGQTLEGVVTITDLMRGRTTLGDAAQLGEFMTRNPVVVTSDDNCAVAANTIAEYRLKSLPVVESVKDRKLVGCLRVRRLMAFALKEGDGKGEILKAETRGPEIRGPQGTKLSAE